MTEFERINKPRVEKILKMLDTIATSARSNGADEDEINELLAPIGIGKGKTTLSHPIALVHLARTEPLPEIVNALAVITARIDQELFERKE